MQGKDTHQKTINITGTPAQTSRRTEKLPPSPSDSKTLCFAQPCFLKGMRDCDMVCSLLEEGLAGNVCLGTKMDVLCSFSEPQKPRAPVPRSARGNASAACSPTLPVAEAYQVMQVLVLVCFYRKLISIKFCSFYSCSTGSVMVICHHCLQKRSFSGKAMRHLTSLS